MNMQEAVRSVLNKYADFTGRARRSEFWFFVLAYFIAAIVTSIIDSIIGVPLTYIILVLGLLVPSIAVTVRRLHDTDKSGWLVLIGLIPVLGAIVLIVFCAMDSEPDNQYGPNPKGAAGPGFPPAYGTPPTA